MRRVDNLITSMCRFSRNIGSLKVLEPYLYVCMYVCMYICMYVRVHIYVFTQTHTHIYMYMCVCVWRMCVCIYIYICICIYVYIYIYGEFFPEEIFLNSVQSMCLSTISATYGPFLISSTLYRVYLKLDKFQERVFHNRIRKKIHISRLYVCKQFSSYSLLRVDFRPSDFYMWR